MKPASTTLLNVSINCCSKACLFGHVLSACAIAIHYAVYLLAFVVSPRRINIEHSYICYLSLGKRRANLWLCQQQRTVDEASTSSLWECLCLCVRAYAALCIVTRKSLLRGQILDEIVRCVWRCQIRLSAKQTG